METRIIMPLVLLLSFVLWGCRDDQIDQERVQSEPTPTLGGIMHIRSLYEDQYGDQHFRDLSPSGILDFSALKVDWEHPIRDTLSQDYEVTAFVLSLDDYRLPISQTLEKSALKEYNGLVSVPRLYHYRHLKTQSEYFLIVVIEPTQDWLSTHEVQSLYRHLRVPIDFDGLLETYKLDKSPQERYVFVGGQVQGYYRATRGEQGEIRSLPRQRCVTVEDGHHFETHSNVQRGELVVTSRRISEYITVCFDETRWEDDGIGWYNDEWSKEISDEDIARHWHEWYPAHIYYGDSWNEEVETAEDRIRKQLRRNCEEFKRILGGQTERSKRILEMMKYRDTAKIMEMHEVGYAEFSDGTMHQLEPVGKDRMILNDSVEQAHGVKGYMHTHPKERPSNSDRDNSMLDIPIQVFSPQDFLTFVSSLRKAHRKGIALNEVYSILVADNYAYQISLQGVSVDSLAESLSKIKFMMSSKAVRRLYLKYCYSYEEEVISPSDGYHRTEPLFSGFAQFLWEFAPMEGLTIQRIDLKTNKTESIQFHKTSENKPQSHGKEKKYTSHSLSTDC